MCGQAPRQWSFWLPLAEWWFNTTFHTALNTTPYQAVYGTAPNHLTILPGKSTNLATVEEMIEERQKQLEIM